jgi:hypothetical protein
MHDADAVADRFDLIHNVTREEHRCTLVALFADDLAENPSTVRVESAEGFVQDEQVGTTDECNGQSEALAHAGGERSDSSFGGVSDTDPLEKFGGVIVGAFHRDRESEVIERSVSTIKSRRFGEHTESFTNGSWIFLRVVAEDGDFAGSPADEIEENIDRRRFTGTIRAEKAEHLASFDLKGDITDGLNGIEPLRE